MQHVCICSFFRSRHITCIAWECGLLLQMEWCGLLSFCVSVGDEWEPGKNVRTNHDAAWMWTRGGLRNIFLWGTGSAPPQEGTLLRGPFGFGNMLGGRYTQRDWQRRSTGQCGLLAFFTMATCSTTNRPTSILWPIFQVILGQFCPRSSLSPVLKENLW